MERCFTNICSNFVASTEPGEIIVNIEMIEYHKFIIINPQNLLEEWHSEENLSIVIVRHPLSRLASVYYQKFVELSTHKSWAKEGLNKTNKQTKIFPKQLRS